VLDKIEGFDWDNSNVGHILRHAVTPFEVEEVTGGKYIVIPAIWPWYSPFAGS
jgi:hypothetical protein